MTAAAPRTSAGLGLRLALGTVTIIPSGDIGTVDRRVARTAMLLTPVAFAPVAGIGVGLGAGAAAWGAPALAAGAVVVAALAYGSRAMHLDGLADTVDGLGGGWTRDRALDIMRRGDVGPMGVAAVVVALLIQASILGALVMTWRGALMALVAVIASRAATAVIASRPFPPARPDGMGALVAGSVPTALAALSTLLLAMLMGAAAWGGSGLDGVVAAASVVVGALAALALAVRARHRLGGVTGDVIGAGVEVFLTVELLVLAGVVA